MEQAPATGEFSLPRASYLQATARHPQCQDSSWRFKQAADALRADAEEYHSGNLLHGLASLLDLAAATSDEAWNEARTRLGEFLSDPATPRLREHYQDKLAGLGDKPCGAAVEQLLDLVPHF